MTRFVILAAPRTGSNLLCTLLDSHPQILCHHEVFNPRGIFTAVSLRDRPLDLGSLRARDRDPMAFLDSLWQARGDYPCVGFKWTRGQNEDVARAVLRDSQIKKIVLRRRNRIKTFISEKIAQETDQWEVYDKQELVFPRPRVKLIKDELLRHISANEQFYTDVQSSLTRLNQPQIEVEYETLFDVAVQKRMLRFLQVCTSARPLRTSSVKQNAMDLGESISNYSDIHATLEGSDLQKELDDRGL